MKKIYTKPVLNMEDFTLSQSIAHNCGKLLDFNQATLKYKSTCGWDLMEDGTVTQQPSAPDSDVLWMSSSICGRVTTDDNYGIVCYNNPGGGYNVFNS